MAAAHLQPIFADLGFNEIVVIAMVFIAFFRWLIDRIRGVNPEQEEEEERYEDFFDEEEEKQRSGPPPIPAGRQQTAQDHPADELRQFLEQLSGAGSSTPPPPPVQQTAVTPPPPPVEVKPKQTLTKAEREALERIKKGEEKFGVSSLHSHQSDKPSVSVHDLLKDPNSIRSAVVLKEILDEPKGLTT